MTATRVVTLPPPGVVGSASASYAEEALAFAREARRRGADAVEIRTDLVDEHHFDVSAIAEIIPLLVAERGRPLPDRWRAHATWIDVPVDARPDDGLPPLAQRLATPGALASLHAERPLQPEEALARWADVPLAEHTLLKHIEPVGAPGEAARLLVTRGLLEERFGRGRVTVLPMGVLAAPFRAVLADENVLDYLALSPAFAAAPGQRLLDDAVRAGCAPTSRRRFAILGHDIAGSRSPRLHPPPFDRLDLPEDAPLGDVLAALHPHYAGFAVTSPFKKAAARATGSDAEAVNTLVRRPEGYASFNTDEHGASAVLRALAAQEVVVLGDGGAAVAVRAAASAQGVRVLVRRRAEIEREGAREHASSSSSRALAAVWTWPPRVDPPATLRFPPGCRVAVIAYGAAALLVAGHIRERGGTPLLLGARWLIAQARGQRRHWETAT